MNTKYLEKCIGNINVQNIENADVEVENNSPLLMIGKGRQGAVFQYSDDICVKVFGNTEDCDREHYALSLGKETTLFPKVYAKGSNYIAMEFIKGVDLREYLQSQPLTEEISLKLIQMLITFKEIGFERIDHHKRQIYLQPDGNLKVIDVARTVWRDRVYPYPRKLLISLGVENKELFLSHVRSLEPQLYEDWNHYIRMEELSRQIYQVLLTKPSNKVKLKKLSRALVTTDDEEKYVAHLTGLVSKVFKEEWIKVMLARGDDHEKIMAKIDEHWDSRENATLYQGNNNFRMRSFSEREMQNRKVSFFGKAIPREKSVNYEKDRYRPSFRDKQWEKNNHSNRRSFQERESFSIKDKQRFNFY